MNGYPRISVPPHPVSSQASFMFGFKTTLGTRFHLNPVGAHVHHQMRFQMRTFSVSLVTSLVRALVYFSLLRIETRARRTPRHFIFFRTERFQLFFHFATIQVHGHHRCCSFFGFSLLSLLFSSLKRRRALTLSSGSGRTSGRSCLICVKSVRIRATM